MKSLSWMTAALWMACGSAESPPPSTAGTTPVLREQGSVQAHMPTQGKPPPPPGGPQGSGAAMQDPTGFPPFHSWPSPQGPTIDALGGWSPPTKLTKTPTGGYRPQISADTAGRLHALYYERTDGGDLIRHRTSEDGKTWTPAAPLGHTENRNWGPDLVTRADGTVVVVYDHALPDFRSRGFLTVFQDGAWAAPAALTPDDGGEVGSGHVADGRNGDLAYVFIGKRLDPSDHFQAHYRWYQDGKWGPIGAFTDGSEDAWHTNVERRPDGSMLAGWDVGTGGAETRLFVVEGRDGRWTQPENISATSRPGERVHFAFGSDGQDHLTWFHKVAGRPIHIYTRSGKPGGWGPTEEPSKGYGGFHFDPDIAINSAGTRVIVWGWDAGTQSELVYSIDRGQGWTPPKKVAQLGTGKPGLPSLTVDPAGRFVVIWNQGIRGYNEVYTATLEVH